jgi:hypothetical protein
VVATNAVDGDFVTEDVLASEDACDADDEDCSLSLRQLRGERLAAVQQMQVEEQQEKEAEQVGEPTFFDLDANGDGEVNEDEFASLLSEPNEEERQALMGLFQLHDQDGSKSLNEDEFNTANYTDTDNSLQQVSVQWHGWSWGGDKLWGGGAGIESVNAGNARYYDTGMSIARSRCGGSSCALIVNPPNARTVNVFHIHSVHFASYGAHLKHKLEREVCSRSGWHGGGLPCHGKATFSSGFHNIFDVAMTGHGMSHASVIAWPDSCGGRGTIVQLAYGCSIEHQIRGDYNPSKR